MPANRPNPLSSKPKLLTLIALGGVLLSACGGDKPKEGGPGGMAGMAAPVSVMPPEGAGDQASWAHGTDARVMPRAASSRIRGKEAFSGAVCGGALSLTGGGAGSSIRSSTNPASNNVFT